MNLTVYGAASKEVANEKVVKTEELGALIARRGHTVVFGGGANGMMGAVARGAHREGGKIIGIAPRFFSADGMLFENCTELIRTDTMRERKQILEDKADGFIITPGGIGTFDELFEILTLRSLGRHDKPIAIYDIDNYYSALEALFDRAVEGKFMKPAVKELCKFFTDPLEMLEYLENFRGTTVKVEDMKSV